MQREKQARTHPKAYLIAGIIAAAALILFGLLSSGMHSQSVSFAFKNQLYFLDAEAAELDAETRRYTTGRNVISFTQEADGTRVTLDLFPYPAETYLVREAGNLVQVDDARGTRRLDGRWQDGELIEPATGRTDSRYWQQRTWESPNPASALYVCMAEQDARNRSMAEQDADSSESDETNPGWYGLLVLMMALGVGCMRGESTRWRRSYRKHAAPMESETSPAFQIAVVILVGVPLIAAILLLLFAS